MSVISKKLGQAGEEFALAFLEAGGYQIIEKNFPLHSPVIDSLKVISKGKVKRAKLFYLRDRTGKAARIETEVVRTAAEPVAA